MTPPLSFVSCLLLQETVAAYEAKYNRLKSRYRELTELHSEEVDKLHDEINTLQERVVELEALAAQLEAARWVLVLSGGWCPALRNMHMQCCKCSVWECLIEAVLWMPGSAGAARRRRSFRRW